MKATIKSLPPPPPVFAPIELTVRIETAEEYRALAALHGMHGAMSYEPLVAGINQCGYGGKYPGLTHKQVWSALHTITQPVWEKFTREVDTYGKPRTR